MKTVLVTGGTVFVSRYIAEFFVKSGWNVYVLNRNSREQSRGVHLIEADRHSLGNQLKRYHFDAVIDTAYTSADVHSLLDALGSFSDYILISSSAVYPEFCPQPFTENTPLGENKFWGKYGTNKIEAETALQSRCPHAYILRPPYLYGPMNNVYREAFVFECAQKDRRFYLPKDGDLNLQFFHVDDLCRFICILLDRKPDQHIFNVGNRETISIHDWVTLCYSAAGKQAYFENVYAETEQRYYFPFYNYAYRLDVSNQCELMPETRSISQGLQECYDWYCSNADQVNRKPLIEYIDKQFA